MVILKLKKPVSSAFECEEIGVDKPDKNLIRPCERYWELYKDCTSIRSRIGQYYVDGKLTDCQIMKDNYYACKEFRKTKNPALLDPIIAWERNLINSRLQSEKQNIAWQLRDKPPEDFESDLPEFIRERQEHSFFKKDKCQYKV